MWYNESVFYQFYPLGMTGAPYENDGVLSHRILQINDWIPHLQKLGINAVYFSPIFESDTHGYNTRDYRTIDRRLGTNEDFALICQHLHDADIRIILDGVFNHAGRGFLPFQDVLKNREQSRYCGWFYLNFDGDSPYNDGFYYEGWEGNYDLVKLNLQNPEVADYLIESVFSWIREFDIDGLRLDVAYMVDRDFLRRLRHETCQKKEDFFLLGEMVHGNYREIMNPEMCNSVTNYECRKGLYSAFNSRNLFEIVHSLLRQFGPEEWTLYKGEHLLSFADNHDVSRLADLLENPRHLPLLYTLMFCMPGIPIIYYGSEWGIHGRKEDGDQALRPAVRKPEWNALTDHIAKLAQIKKNSNALQYGDFTSLHLTNQQCVLQRRTEDERILIVLNIDENDYTAYFDSGAASAIDLLTGETVSFTNGLRIPAYTDMVLQIKS